ncbi:DUF3298 and DUF4163 domain-containing protein [Niallia sp. 01092]|uniref:DUF3298 and DUF4163 domain-containing protein n=1 Tax=unclassified Niallia TaxID=2837522 RepID=UPI003FD1CE57
MKNSVKYLIVISLILSLFFYTFPLQHSHASRSANAAITTKYYQNNKNLKYPIVSNIHNKTAQSKINAVLTAHIKKSAKAYHQLMQQMEEDKKKDFCKDSPSRCQYEYVTNFEVKNNKKDKLSILFFDYQFTGGAHGNTVVTSYNFSLKDGHLYSLDDFFTSAKTYKKVTSYAKNYMLKHPDIFYPDPKEFDSFQITNQTQFYFADDGLNLIFQQYEVGPYVSGHPVIKIPSSLYSK